MEPGETGSGFEFVNKVVGGDVPKEYIPAVKAGVEEALESGVIAGFPVVDVKVTLKGGSYHEVDSSEAGVQDGGFDGCPGRGREGQVRLSRNRSCASKSSFRRTSSAM